MQSDPINSITPQTAAPTGAVSDAARSDAQRQQVKRLAQEFEAMLMTQMLREMRRSMVSEEPDGGFGAETMTDVADIELGRALSSVGGFGLSSVLMKALERQTGTSNAAAPAVAPAEAVGHAEAPAAIVPAAEAGPATAPVAAPEPTAAPEALAEPGGIDSIPRAMPGPITSNYGWRRDPITGAPQFHSGVDVAMAYGADVHAAANGRVVFSGANGGYGNMVIVEHGGGQQTRYAHLSGLNVRTGDPIQNGQVIGRVGSTGRSTGPHLHFEVVDNGRAVNPGARIKGAAASAD